MVTAGRLYVVATPIGNLADLSTRARATLGAVDHILAEDTRRARVLLGHVGISTRPVSLHAHNEASRIELVRSWLAAGDTVALVSDAGTPLLSDPGERLATALVENDHAVVPVPGPSAILASLVAAALPCVPFRFVGFLPRKSGERSRALERIVRAVETNVLFESPARLVSLLDALASAGEFESGRRVAVCREMTKVHEEVVRGSAGACAEHFRRRAPRGEVTVVIEGRAHRSTRATASELDGLAERALDAGLAPTAAARDVAARADVTRGDAYKAVQRVKDRRRAREDLA